MTIEHKLLSLISHLEPDPWMRQQILDALHDPLVEDLRAYASRDPASPNDTDLILRCSSSFQGVIHHRVANLLWHQERRLQAFAVSSAGKRQSGIDIHPAATIGRRFILDHAWGTVVGETTEIGDDCYLLGGITLGACGIANNPNGKRHPTLGHRVQVGAFSRILGPINIGDDCFIAPSSVITQDLPSKGRVSIVNQLQVSRNLETSECKTKIHGAYVDRDSVIVLFSGTQPESAVIVDQDFASVQWVRCRCNLWRDNILMVSLSRDVLPHAADSRREYHLQFNATGAATFAMRPYGLRNVIAKLADIQLAGEEHEQAL